MKYYIFSIALGFLMMSCGNSGEGGQQQTEATAQIAKTVSVTEFKKLMQDKPGTVLDVRTPKEFDNGAIANATNIDWYSKSFEKDVAALDKEKPVYVYCHSGGRSKSAMKKLKSMGFSTVYELQGGMMAWNRNK